MRRHLLRHATASPLTFRPRGAIRFWGRGGFPSGRARRPAGAAACGRAAARAGKVRLAGAAQGGQSFQIASRHSADGLADFLEGGRALAGPGLPRRGLRHDHHFQERLLSSSVKGAQWVTATEMIHPPPHRALGWRSAQAREDFVEDAVHTEHQRVGAGEGGDHRLHAQIRSPPGDDLRALSGKGLDQFGVHGAGK